jgi:hypothetical protein
MLKNMIKTGNFTKLRIQWKIFNANFKKMFLILINESAQK